MAADRGRDLKISVISDASKFDLSDPADELEDLAKSSDDATDELKRLAAQGEDAQRELDRLRKEAKSADSALDSVGDEAGDAAKAINKAGDEAEDTATKFKTAGEKIESSSKRGFDKAGDASTEFKDEAKQNLSEVTSSFDGSFESIQDVVQGTLGGLVSGFGGFGAALAGGAAVGIGALAGYLQNAAEEAEEARQRMVELSQAIVDAGGAIEDVDIAGQMREWADEIVDNKSWWELWQDETTDNLARVKQAAEDTGVETTAMFRAMSGYDSEAAATVLADLETKIKDVNRELEIAARQEGLAPRDDLKAQKSAYEDAASAIRDNNDLTAEAIERARLLAEVTRQETAAQEAATAAQEARNDAAAALQDGLETAATAEDDFASAVEAAAKRRAKSTSDENDTWNDYVDDVKVGADEIIKQQERDIAARAKFQENAQKVYDAVGQAGVDWALAQGENAAQAMQLLAKAPKDKQQQIVSNFTTLGDKSGEALVSGLTGAKPEMESAAQSIYTVTKNVFGKPVEIKVNLKSPTYSEITAARAEVARQVGTIKVPVSPGVVRWEQTSRTTP